MKKHEFMTRLANALHCPSSVCSAALRSQLSPGEASSLPQERNPCATKKTKKHGCAPRRKAAFPLQNQKNHKKMTIRCNEIAFSFVLYHEGGYVINAADSTQ